MRMLIFGCSRLTTLLVPELAAGGHRITVLEENPDSLRQLEETRQLELILVSEPQMQDYLRMGGIDSAEAFLALSDNDQQNALLAQVARKIFNIPRVLCNLDDPHLQQLYSRLGLKVIGPSYTTLEEMHQLMEGPA
jgi:trk system potassium uptake protein TrkA